MNFMPNPDILWRNFSGRIYNVEYVGSQVNPRQILEILEHDPFGNEFESIFKKLINLGTGWAFIARSPDLIIAAVDPIKSYQIFYGRLKNLFLASNSAKVITERLGITQTSNIATTEFLTAGYVTGYNTLIDGLYQLQAGECIVYESNSSNLIRRRYYRYLPKPDKDRSVADWAHGLKEITEAIFRRLIQSADGRQLVVPLSGGLDSRLIVTMLSHLGYDNVKTFSYGPRANHEARIAKKVAEQAGYPWEFYPMSHKEVYDFFWSRARQDYWSFSDSLSAVPNMQDVQTITMLRRRGVSEDAIIVNGQSGDFISGGHLPKHLFAGRGIDAVIWSLLHKHFKLRLSLFTPNNLDLLVSQLQTSLGEIERCAGRNISPAALFESWEWQERQCKYVIAGQRAYDWVGFDWALPLWDLDYLKFWSKVPFELKVNQSLYRKFLVTEDYCGLFRNFNPKVWRWPGQSIAVIPAAQVVGLAGGQRAKDNFYAYARYIGHYGPQYAPWGLGKFLRETLDVRHALPFYIDSYLYERGIGFTRKSHTERENFDQRV